MSVTATRWWHALLAAVGILAFATAWAIATPMGSSPDERAHIIYSYGVATGQTLPGNESLYVGGEGPLHTEVTVPGSLLEFSTCYAFDIPQPADCEITQHPEMVDSSTYHTRYPPPYYAVEGLILRAALGAGLDGDTTLVLARVFSGVVNLTLICAAGLTLVRRFSTAGALLVLAATLTPTTLSLMSAVNPNGLEIAAAVLTAALVCAVRHDQGRGVPVTRGLATGLVLGFLLLTWARPLGLAWAGLLFLVLYWPARGQPFGRTLLRSARTVPFVLIVLNFLAGLAWLVYSFGSRNVTTNADDEGWGGVPLVAKPVLLVLKFGELLYQSIAAMGWDVSLPDFFPYAWILAATAVIALGVSAPHRTATAFSRALLFVLASAATVALYSLITGFGWQGRYWSPALAAFLVLSVPSLGFAHLAPSRARTLRVTAAATFVLLQLASFLWFMWRHVYGVQFWYDRFPSVPLPLVGPAWGPIGGQKLALLLYLVGAVAAAVLIAQVVRRDRAVVRSPAGPSDGGAGDPGRSHAAPSDAERSRPAPRDAEPPH